ncbi:FG-GAP repeat domain-containing protein [Aureliella helgolandensis]|uniref:FG-GAP repeat domain-containing protein n=1 Tax=Aureliella helgolandensis TaxID=2527968 RepID=UPI0018D0DB36|nr:VCBS repeat-containing protein [Aureliella helgolandensis]
MFILSLSTGLQAAWPQSPTVPLSSAPAIILTDVTDATGIDFVHTDGSDGRHFIVESFSAGLAVFDFDNDGDLDIYFLNGCSLGGSVVARATNVLYRNDGEFQFTDVTAQAGVGDTGYAMGVAAADYDNDGDVDLYVNNYGTNRFFVNNGDGTFSDRTQASGSANGELVGSGVSFLDYDRDGNLDLYVGNYVQFEESQHRVHHHKGLPAYPSPLQFTPQVDTLFRNSGDGNWTDVSQVTGITNVAGRSMAVTSCDFDLDGDIDILVANDTQENFYFQNDAAGQFEEVGLLAGLALDFQGRVQGSMGIELADFNHDALVDVVMSSFADEFLTLYSSSVDGYWIDSTPKSGLGPETRPQVTWGVAVADFDLDGQLDLFVGCGGLDDNHELRGGSNTKSAFDSPNLLFRNQDGSRFETLSNWGSGTQVRGVTRGLIAADLDSDGDSDVVVLNARGRPTLLRNDTPTGNRAIAVTLIGTRCNRDAIGSRVTAKFSDGSSQTQFVVSGRSYQSDLRAPLVLVVPPGHSLEQLEVFWPGETEGKIHSIGPSPEHIVQP